MSATNKIFLLLALLFNSEFVLAKDIDWPKELFPDDSHVKIIAERMKFNGIPMKIWEFTAIAEYNAVRDFYRRNWQLSAEGLKPGSPGFQIAEAEDGCVISRVDREFMITVQLKRAESGQSLKGNFAISKLLSESASEFELGKDFPAMAGTEFINDIEAIDGQKKSRTIMAVAGAPYKSVVNFYRSTMKRKGWLEQTEQSQADNRGITLMFVSPSKEMNISILPENDKVNIVAVETRE